MRFQASMTPQHATKKLSTMVNGKRFHVWNTKNVMYDAVKATLSFCVKFRSVIEKTKSRGHLQKGGPMPHTLFEIGLDISGDW